MLRVSKNVRGDVYLPTVVTTEVAYLVQRDLGQEDLAKFLDLLASETFVLVELTADDYQRAAQVVRQYADSQIDFVDATLVAVAERLNIVRILTLDARHFRLFRPKHCVSFEILP